MLLRDVKTYIAQYDISTSLNQIALSASCSPVPNTTFGATTETNEAGLFSPSMNGVLVYGSDGSTNANLYTKFAVADVPITLSPDGGDAGEVAYFMQALQATHTPLDQTVGDLWTAAFSAVGSGGIRMTRGVIFVASGARAASFNSSIIQLGAAGATQRVCAALHVFSASGSTPTLDVAVKSAALIGFGSPTSRLTFTQATTSATSEFKASTVGAITDQFYRVDVTIGGSTPSYSLVCAVGITS
jgi:hypothetical protein